MEKNRIFYNIIYDNKKEVYTINLYNIKGGLFDCLYIWGQKNEFTKNFLKEYLKEYLKNNYNEF